MEYGRPAHAAGKDEAGRDPGDGAAVQGRSQPDEARRRFRSRNRHRRRTRGRAGGALDHGQGGLEQAHAAAVDLLPDRQGDPGGLRQPQARG